LPPDPEQLGGKVGGKIDDNSEGKRSSNAFELAVYEGSKRVPQDKEKGRAQAEWPTFPI
jgi:hypothetical protein